MIVPRGLGVSPPLDPFTQQPYGPVVDQSINRVYGPTDAQLGVVTSSIPGYDVGSVQDQLGTCMQAGGPPQACYQAVFGASPTAGKLPSWAIPAGIGTLLFVLLLGVARR